MNTNIKSKYLILLIISIGLILIIGNSFAVFTERLEGQRKYVITAGDLKVKLDEEKSLENIIQDGSLPISDFEGKSQEGYNFSLVNDQSTELEYTIYLVEDTVSKKTPSNDIKMYLSRDHGNINELRNLSEVDNNEKKVLDTGIISKNTTYNYNLKLWIDKNAENEILGTSYSCHIEVVAKQIIKELY